MHLADKGVMRINPIILSIAMLSAIPFFQLSAEVTGASAGLSGAPGDSTCVSCHGSRVNSNGGSVTITTANGASYIPGQATQVTVTVADPTAKVWGFEASPRVT